MRVKLFVICLLIVGLSVNGFAGEKKDPEVRLEITIVYNSILIAEAAKIHKKILEENKDACKVEVVSKKVDNSVYTATSYTTAIDDRGWVTYITD